MKVATSTTMSMLMSIVVVALLTGSGEAATLRTLVGSRQRRASGVDGRRKFGTKECQCIGFAGFEGHTLVTLGEQEVKYPAGLGASCQAWDEDLRPECREGGEQPSWCKERWCYVDIRDCHIPELPKMALATRAYQPKVRFQNVGLHYSYATCDSRHTWAREIPVVGKAGCRCIGLDNSVGSRAASTQGRKYEYPAEVGGACKPWDADRYPGCEGESAPDWCDKPWCFVDPCACDLEVQPKETTVLEGATFQGRPIFYSYDTCDSKDTYSSKAHLEASRERQKEVCSSQKGFGDERCPCIGFDGIQGETLVTIGQKEVRFPADLGGRCTAWDAEHHPDCQGDARPSWCNEKWCYVDPRACNIAVMPKLAPPETAYQPDARYQRLPLYYSYSTCGSKDLWAAETPEIGRRGCQCIGFNNARGTVQAKAFDKEIEYPAEVGGRCSTWDQGRFPGCEGQGRQDWCAKRWCFVDPCSCNLEESPKVSEIAGAATFQGRPMFYSYATCGEEDSFSSKAQVEASKKMVTEVCEAAHGDGEKEKEKERGLEKKEQKRATVEAPREKVTAGARPEDPTYNHSGYENDWRTEWRNGSYPKWVGAK